MKYIGPFLRINTLNKTNVKNQLFHFSKESLKYLSLYSKFGIIIKPKDLKIKNISTDDINIIEYISPLLCIYKKCNAKVVIENDNLLLNEDTFKKDIIIRSNAFLTLSLLELCEYYRNTSSQQLKALGEIYLSITKQQLDFYEAYMRNIEGLFIDKKDISDSILNELRFEQKKNTFSYADQGLLMCAFYKYSILDNDDSTEPYKHFSLDIFKMLQEYKNDIYNIDCDELLYLCFALNLFYKYSNSSDCITILMDLQEYLYENNINEIENNLKLLELLTLNTKLLYENSNIIKYKGMYEKLYTKLISYYDEDTGLFIKNDNSNAFTSDELTLFLVNSIINEDDNNSSMVVSMFRNQLINSGIALSWPDAPNLDNSERYKNQSMQSDDLIDEQNFKLITAPTPYTNELAPVFVKKIEYNRRKNKFKHSKENIDSTKHLTCCFFIIHFLMNKLNIKAKE